MHYLLDNQVFETSPLVVRREDGVWFIGQSPSPTKLLQRCGFPTVATDVAE